MSSVREALVASVTKVRPAVRCQTRKLSTVPAASSPASARRRASGTLSRIQAILVAEKYGSMTRPVRSADPCLAVLEPVAGRGRPPVLPDQGRRDRLAGRALPDDRRLALVGQADGRDPVGPHARLVERPGHLRTDRSDQGIRVVLDPARVGVSRQHLRLALAHDLEPSVIDDGPRAGRPLIDHQEMVARHRSVS